MKFHDLKNVTFSFDNFQDKVAAADYKPDEDPTKFKSEKTGRGPLINSNWRNEAQTSRFDIFPSLNRKFVVHESKTKRVLLFKHGSLDILVL